MNIILKNRLRNEASCQKVMKRRRHWRVKMSVVLVRERSVVGEAKVNIFTGSRN